MRSTAVADDYFVDGGIKGGAQNEDRGVKPKNEG